MLSVPSSEGVMEALGLNGLEIWERSRLHEESGILPACRYI